MVEGECLICGKVFMGEGILRTGHNECCGHFLVITGLNKEQKEMWPGAKSVKIQVKGG